MSYKRRTKKSALVFVLKGLIPYSRENLMLAYKPNMFFNELGKISGYRQETLKNAYWRAKKEGLVEERSNISSLTNKGLKEVRPFTAKSLGKKARLIIMFDIPEKQAAKRQYLRDMLKSLEFKQVQKSVWATNLDHKSLLIEAIAELKLEGCVEIHESIRLFPSK